MRFGLSLLLSAFIMISAFGPAASCTSRRAFLIPVREEGPPPAATEWVSAGTRPAAASVAASDSWVSTLRRPRSNWGRESSAALRLPRSADRCNERFHLVVAPFAQRTKLPEISSADGYRPRKGGIIVEATNQPHSADAA